MNELTFQEDGHKYFLLEGGEENGKGIEIPHVTGILEAAGLLELPPGINLKLIKRKLTQGEPLTPAEDMWVRAGEFGTAVHKACELYDLGTLNESILDINLKPWLESWKIFKKEFGITFFEAIEIRVYSKRWRFAGTVDRGQTINGKRTLIDIKTPTVLQDWVSLQLAGYQIAHEEMTKLKIKQRWGVRLRPGQRPEIKPYNDKSDRDVFIGALQVSNWKKRRG